MSSAEPVPSQATFEGFRPSQLHEQRFSVDFEYPVVFCRGALNPRETGVLWCIARREPERRHPVFAVLDAMVHYVDAFVGTQVAPCIPSPDGVNPCSNLSNDAFTINLAR